MGPSGRGLESAGSTTPVTMSDCHVKNCRINGTTNVGYIQGRNSFTEQKVHQATLHKIHLQTAIMTTKQQQM